jgi:hypothetical protein
MFCVTLPLSPQAQAEGSPPGDAVPNEVRDASLSLGKTIKRMLGRT